MVTDDYARNLELYEKLVSTNPDVERKGASMPYTSLNGHMFTLLTKEGSLIIRLPSEERELYMEKYGTDPTATFHAHSYDAAWIVFDAIEKVAIVEDDDTIHIGRQALIDELFATSGFEGITGTIYSHIVDNICYDNGVGISQDDGTVVIRNYSAYNTTSISNQFVTTGSWIGMGARNLIYGPAMNSSNVFVNLEAYTP